MGRKRIRKPGQKQAQSNVQQPTPPTQDELDVEMGSDADIEDPMEQDATELELERRVFGDDAGFREELKAHAKGGQDEEGSSEDDIGLEDEESNREDEAGGVTGLDDSDLFFLDSGPSGLNGQAVVPPLPSADEEDRAGAGKQAAWEDSEDERMHVSLASDSRLRKLRVREGEDVINGREYSKRLRRQFERLYPQPDWATQTATSTLPKKKRRTSSAHRATSLSSSSSSSDENDSSEEVEATQPLAKFLQDPSALAASPPVKPSRLKLRPEVLDMQRTPDLPGAQPSAITNLDFHPQYPALLMTSGPSSLISLYHLTSIPAPTLLTSLHLRSSSSLSTASFHSLDGLSVYLSTLQKRHFHIWDLRSGMATKVSRIYGHRAEQRNMARFKLSPCGRYMALLSSTGRGGSSSEGSINILDARTTQWITQAQLESPSSGVQGAGGIADFCWWRDGEGISVALKSGEIGEFHVASRRFLTRWIGDGVTSITTIALGGASGPSSWGTDRYLAIGSTSGIVDVYDRRAVHRTVSQLSSSGPLDSTRLQPMRSLGHLTTPISNLRFSPDGQVLVLSSRWKADALRLVHLPSCAVYKNWPTSSTPLGRVTSVAWALVGPGETSKGCSASILKLAIGNEAGKVRVWEVRG